MLSKEQITNLRTQLAESKTVMACLENTLALSEGLLFYDLKEAESLANEVKKLSEENDKKNAYFKANTMLLRVFRATARHNEALSIATKLLDLFSDNIEVSQKFLVYNSLANIHVERIEFEKARYYCDKVKIELLEDLDDSYTGHYHNDLGKIYEKMSFTDLAIGEHKKSLVYFQKCNNQNGEAKALFSIGVIFINMDKPKEAMPYFEETLEIDKKLNSNNPMILLQSYALIARCHYTLGDFKKGLKNYKSELKLALETKDELWINRVKSDEAFFSSLEKNHNKSILISEELLKIDSFKKDSFFCFQVESTLGLSYTELGHYDKAIPLLLKSIEYRKEIKDPTSNIESFKFLAKAYEQIGDLEKALSCHKEYTQLLIDAEQEKSNNALEQFQVQFETTKKEQDSVRFKAESLKFELQFLRAQMNPHFLFNALNSISNTISDKTIDKSKQLVKNFARLMRSNLEFAETDKITLEDEVTFLDDYLSIEQNRLTDQLTFSISVDKDIDTEFTEIPSMLLQPFIENSIKHGIQPKEGTGHISINFKEVSDQLICSIEDNGIGRKQASKNQKDAEKHLGKSTSINAKRLELYNENRSQKVKSIYTDLTDETGNVIGTSVEIQIPL